MPGLVDPVLHVNVLAPLAVNVDPKPAHTDAFVLLIESTGLANKLMLKVAELEQPPILDPKTV